MNTNVKRVVLVDVDGVVADLMPEWVRRYNELWGDTLTCDSITSWQIVDFVKPECGKRIYEILFQSTVYDNVQPVAGALEGVRALRDYGYRVVFVTASNPVSAGSKMRWLEQHGFTEGKAHYGDVVIAYDKSLLSGFAMIDDGEHNLKTARVALPLLFPAPHNAENADKYIRVRDWAEIVDLLVKNTYL